jgi:hypothetical protein
MSLRARRSPVPLAAALVLATACGDATAPTREVALSFCPYTVWAGVQNDGQAWRTVATGAGTVRVEASERLTVAVGRRAAVDEFALTFYYLTREQARATLVCPGTGGTGAKQLSGSLAGVGDGFAEVFLGRDTAFGNSLRPDFTLSGLPAGPLDLVATHANTAIVRRGADYPDGATVPVLDFAAAEAFALQAHALTIDSNGVVGPRWSTDVLTRGGTWAHLSSSSSPCCADGRIYTLPADRQETGDLYRLTVSDVRRLPTVSDDWRVAQLFYETPSDQAVAFGPPVNAPTYTPVAAAGQLWRAEVAAQPEYGSQVEFRASAPQPSSNQTTVTIKASKEYFGGTPATWTFTVPDLSGVAGFPVFPPQLGVPGGGVWASGAPWPSASTPARAGSVYRGAGTFSRDAP